MIEDCACGHGHMGDVRLVCNVRACGCQEYRAKFSKCREKHSPSTEPPAKGENGGTS